MWPWLARAAYDASDSATPCRRTRKSATSGAVGVASETSRQRLRIVGSTSSTVGAHSTHTVRSAGSSTALSTALPEESLKRSASSTTITCHRWLTGLMADFRTISRASLTRNCTDSVDTRVTSGWEPASVVMQALQPPHPAAGPGPFSHCSAAAKAIAVLERPDPGGPVSRNAWVMPCPDAAARRVSMTGFWPTRSSQTLTAGPPRAHGSRRRSPRSGLGRRARGSGRGRPRPSA